METPLTPSRQRQHLLLSVIAIAVLVFTSAAPAFGQKFKPGDSVECDPTGTGDFMKGTVVAYQERDNPTFQGDYYLTRVVIETWRNSYPDGVLCQTKQVRLRNAEAAQPPATKAPVNEPTTTAPGAGQAVEPGAKFKPGDRVECDTMNIGTWYKGTVLPFEAKDEPGKFKDATGNFFYIHRVRLDNEAATRPAGGMCFTDRTRLLAGAAATPPPVDRSVGPVTTDADGTVSADRPILSCPVAQPKVGNGTRPNAELLKKIVRCDKGEKPAAKGVDGAVTVDVAEIDIAASRPWVYTRDMGGKPGTTIYPVRVTYTVKTFYRYRTAVEENWVRTINFYVNEFGEWQSGSEEPVKGPQSREIPRLP